ncbi:PD-(D/E)XK nuclease family protein [Halarcobacter sp.]|uniref:PD-(D/E)XK nuclease family protein n=1 Tax=Halarcobacter sp. TaxID=2321133 RepID=UPI0029F55579|nr:PD-(D/E)XK nuclease family protein [Halarcobacter sp.]
MSNDKNEYEQLEEFIFNDEVQNTLSEISDNVMDFNILEITGMGTQEVKHSNILGWLFDDSEHNLEYLILEDFLKKVVDENNNKKIESLKHYLYLPKNKNRDITVFREKDYIDLLIVDEANKFVITIENKLYASERVEDGGGGQLNDYERIINEKYSDEYTKYFIFLTINLEEPTRNNWLKASHTMVANTIENILKSKDISVKTKILLESYIDLMKRRGIVEDKKLEELCEKIWLNKDYAEALNILIQHKTTITKKFYEDKLDDEFDFKDDSVFIKLESTDKIYEILDLNWDDIEETIFDISCEYENEDIVLYFSHRALYNEDMNEDIQNICNKIKNKKSKKYEEIKRYTIDDFVNKGEKFVIDDMKETINRIDTTLLSMLNKLN